MSEHRTPFVPPSADNLGGRRCANCACFFESTDPKIPNSPIQGFCQRNGAVAHAHRVERPKVDEHGHPVMLPARKRDMPGIPAMESVQEIAYVYAPTAQNLTCFDGWRPIGTLPGDRPLDTSIRKSGPALGRVLAKTGSSTELVNAFLACFGIDQVDGQ